MTLQEIQELAGHREVSPWIVKLVGDAVARERERICKLLDEMNEQDNLTNYYGVAARKIRGGDAT